MKEREGWPSCVPLLNFFFFEKDVGFSYKNVLFIPLTCFQTKREVKCPKKESRYT